MIIAVDGGLYNIGIVVMSTDAEIYTHKHIKTNNKSKYHPNILNGIYHELEQILNIYDDFACVYEAPNIHNKARSAFGHLKMIGVLEVLCAKHGVLVQPSIVASHWKKIVLGKGNATKEEVMDYVKANYKSLDEISQHEADAICIGLCYIKETKQ